MRTHTQSIESHVKSQSKDSRIHTQRKDWRIHTQLKDLRVQAQSFCDVVCVHYNSATHARDVGHVHCWVNNVPDSTNHSARVYPTLSNQVKYKTKCSRVI